MKPGVDTTAPDRPRDGLTVSGGPLPELAVMGLLLLAGVAAPLAGMGPDALVFLPGAVAAGEWWRVVSHPWIHVSVYHLLLDGSAFALCYLGLASWPRRTRILAVLATGAGALLAAVLADAGLATHGLCGLSGIAHGLMAANCVTAYAESGDDRFGRRLAALALAATLAKAVAETLTGRVLLAAWHWGNVGVPVAACHAGGCLAGIAVAIAVVCRRRPRARVPERGVLSSIRVSPGSGRRACRRGDAHVLEPAAAAVERARCTAETAGSMN